MTNKILDLNEALVSKILYDFDTELHTRFSSSLFQFILATDEISDGMFHDSKNCRFQALQGSSGTKPRHYMTKLASMTSNCREDTDCMMFDGFQSKIGFDLWKMIRKSMQMQPNPWKWPET